MIYNHDAVYVDLVFILLDRPDESHDKLISEHIMNNRSSHQLNSHTNRDRDDDARMKLGECSTIKTEDDNVSSKRMRLNATSIYGRSSANDDSMDGMDGMRGMRGIKGGNIASSPRDNTSISSSSS